MKCIAIASQTDSSKIQWHLPNANVMTKFFFHSAKSTYQSEIMELLHDIESNHQVILPKEGYILHIQKFKDQSVAIVTDQELSMTQLYYLSKAVLIEKISLEEVAAHLPTYSVHRDMVNIQDELDELQTQMLDNIDKLLARGEKIEALLARTEALNESALSFKLKSEELNNRCLPRGCTII